MAEQAALEAAVVQAVAALYFPDPAQQALANQWLTAFQAGEDAWRVPFPLLSPSQPQEVQFFAASLLVRKVRSEWTRLDPPTRQALAQAVRSKFGEVLGWQSPATLVLRQLCVLLAAVAGASGGEGGSDVVTQAAALLPASPSLAMELLAALAEEAADLDRVRRLALLAVLVPRAREVLGLAGAALADALQSGRVGEAVAVASLRCVERWLGLSEAAERPAFSPGELRSAQPQLFASLLSALAGPAASDALAEASTQVLLALFSGGAGAGDEAEERAACGALLGTLGALGPRLADAASETLPLAVARLGAALAEGYPEECAGGAAGALQLSQAMLACLAQRDPGVAEAAVDYFLALNTVPLAERLPALGAPLYEAMLGALGPHASYPPDFTSWRCCYEGADEESWGRMREQVLPEALDVAYCLLRMAYLNRAWELLRGARSWQGAEAALFLVRSVALGVRTRVMADSAAAGGEGATPAAVAVARDRSESRALLLSVFEQLCGGSEAMGRWVGGPAPLARGAASLIDAFSPWFAKDQGSPLQGALQLLVLALGVPEACQSAATAFENMCLRCAGRLSDPASVESLTAAALDALQRDGAAGGAAGLGAAGREAIVGGLSRVTCGLPGPQQAAAALSLVAPFLRQARSALAASGSNGSSAPEPWARLALADALRLVAASLRFLAPAGDTAGAAAVGSVVAVLQEGGDVLSAVAGSAVWLADADVAGALAQVYRRALGSAKRAGSRLLPEVLPAVVGAFRSAALPSCLDVVGEALEFHFQDPALVAALLGALGSACEAAFPQLAGAGLREHPLLASSLLGLGDHFAVYAPAALWPSPALAPLLQLAVAAAGMREGEPVGAALALAGHLLGGHVQAAEEGRLTAAHLDAAHAALAAVGEALVRALLGALCDTCPRRFMRPAADCLRTMLAHPALGQQARAWFVAALQGGQLAGGEGPPTAEDCSTLCSIALGGSLRGPRLVALLVDFGLIARGENTPDVLLAYEL